MAVETKAELDSSLYYNHISKELNEPDLASSNAIGRDCQLSRDIGGCLNREKTYNRDWNVTDFSLDFK